MIRYDYRVTPEAIRVQITNVAVYPPVRVLYYALCRSGVTMDDEELLELISERKTISKTVEEYAGRKSTSLTTAGKIYYH